MRPVWSIIADGADVTEAVRDRLVSLTVTDEAGTQSDQVEIIIGDPKGLLAAPRKGAELRVSMGYAPGATDLGLYLVDEVSMDGPPDRIIVVARAADFQTRLKVKQTRSWTATTLGEIVTAIAAEHGLTPAVDPILGELAYAQIDQTAESDLHFLTRLAAESDGVAKTLDGHLVLALKGQAKQVISGAPLPSFTIGDTEIVNWSVTAAERSAVSGFRAAWQDAETGERRELVEGDETGPVEAIAKTFESEERARTAAASKLKQATRSTAELSLTLVGRPDIQAESPIDLAHRREEVSGRWIVNRAVHTLSPAGLVTTLSAKRS